MKPLHAVLLCAYTVVLALILVDPVQGEKDFYELLGVSREASLREIRKAFKKIALTEHPDKKPDDPNAHDDFLRINRAYEVLKDEDLRKKYDTYGEKGLKDDAPSGRGYQSWKFYNQEFGIYDNDEEIVTLSKSDFEQLVENTQDVWFINFYSPHCSHCHDLAPTWREVAQELEGVIRIGAVNCQDDWMLCRSQGIRSYPSLLMYPQKEKYHGDRKRKELVKHALRHVNSRVHELWSGNYDSIIKDGELSRLPWLLTFCGDGGDCLESWTLTKLSAMMDELVNVGVMDCHTEPQVCEKLHIDHGTFYFPARKLRKEDAVEISSLDAQDVAQAVLEQLPEINTVNEETFKALLDKLKQGSQAKWLIHFVENEERNLDLRKLPSLIPDFFFAKVDCRTMRTLCNDLFIFKFPKFVLFKTQGQSEVHHGRDSAHDVAAFAREVAKAAVETLGPADFPHRVMETGDPWMVDFFAPWCPPCMKLLPEFRKASRQMDEVVRFGTVDCTIHNTLCHKYNIRSYPTTIFYNQTVPHQFHGHHKASAIVEFLQDTMNPPVIILNEQSFKDNIRSKSADVIWMVDFFAPWCGPCQQLTPDWRRLAKMSKDEPLLKVASVDCVENKPLCQEEGVRSYPAIRLYPTGSTDSRKFHVYHGWYRDAQSLHAWAYEFMPSLVTNLQDNKFHNEVLFSAEPWLVDFYAPWCSHCKVFAPELEKIAKAMEGKVNTGKIDCDSQPYVCQRAGVNAYPTVRFYKGVTTAGHQQSVYGEEIDSQSATEIIQLLNKRVSQRAKHKHPHDEF